jgi:gamma-glutamyl hercynylcysteine S-oxide synthase
MIIPGEIQRLIGDLTDARARTLQLVKGLDAGQLMGSRLDVVNPILWEIGHVAWFHEYFVLRRLDGGEPRLDRADSIYNSSTVPHDARWELPLPSLTATLDYLTRVQEALVSRLTARPADTEAIALTQLAIFHEDMHGEALIYTRQTLEYSPPDFTAAGEGGPDVDAGPWPGDVELPGGTLMLGAPPGASFAFDNEKWAHPVTLAPFRIARATVTNAEFREFVADGGYEKSRFWDAEGWSWRKAAGARHPVYWNPRGGRWTERWFDRWVALRPHRPINHVNWYEAMAWCRWAGRRLPTEAEWEAAAATEPGPTGGFASRKRRYPWREGGPDPTRANLDGTALGTVDVSARAAGDSAWGCRQMLGNVWEWTASSFQPYPGFAPDAYEDYSAPWFGSRKVLRGGAWMTRGRMISNTYRNFFTPERRDIPAGFRTCAV